jgi:hypothetical protein
MRQGRLITTFREASKPTESGMRILPHGGSALPR